jgi:hypothetical protein
LVAGVTFATSIALSLHLGLEAGYNAIHPALWLEQEGWKAGGYLNSNEEVSMFALRRFGGKRWIEAGVVSGYHVPFLVRAGVDIVDRVSLWAAPALSRDSDVGAVLGVEMRLWH